MKAENREINHLKADHEEADTRIILHVENAIKQGYERIIIHSRDADVLVMIVSFLSNSDSEVWMKAGSKKKSKKHTSS